MKVMSTKQYVKEILKARKEEMLKENAIIVKETKDKEKEEEENSKYHEKIVEKTNTPVKYNKFMESVKENFVGECIYNVFNNSLTVFDRLNESQNLVKVALVKNFVQEQGATKLLNRFKNQNSLLSEYALICNKAIKAVAESTDTYNKNSWTVDADIKNQFIDDLKNCNSKDAIITITDRVSDAETDFVNDNIRKKIEIDDILKNKKDRLDAISEKPTEIKESVSAIYDRKINAVKNRYTTSIYQTIAENMTKNALTDPQLQSIYIKDGKLNMKALLEDAGIMYTFLETLYTTEMVNESYIKEFVNNI